MPQYFAWLPRPATAVSVRWPVLIIEIIGGLFLLLIGGEFLVRGSVQIAREAGVSPLVIGLTLVGFGTSMPELVTSVQAALIGAPGIAIGNIVGSNIANVLLILGISALISPIVCARDCIKRDGSVMVVASLIMLAIAVAGLLGRLHGALLLTALAAYLAYAWRSERANPAVRHSDAHGLAFAETGTAVIALPSAVSLRGLMAGATTLAGLVILVIGARLLVTSSIQLATAAGVSQTVIGLTLVALGTSLPELATSLVAAYRRHGDIALGNILGSNIFNIFGIAGVTALVEPIAVPAEIMDFDIWVMLASALVLILFGWTGRRISRGEGAILFGAYILYVAALIA